MFRETSQGQRDKPQALNFLHVAVQEADLIDVKNQLKPGCRGGSDMILIGAGFFWIKAMASSVCRSAESLWLTARSCEEGLSVF